MSPSGERGTSDIRGFVQQSHLKHPHHYPPSLNVRDVSCPTGKQGNLRLNDRWFDLSEIASPYRNMLQLRPPKWSPIRKRRRVPCSTTTAFLPRICSRRALPNCWPTRISTISPEGRRARSHALPPRSKMPTIMGKFCENGARGAAARGAVEDCAGGSCAACSGSGVWLSRSAGRKRGRSSGDISGNINSGARAIEAGETSSGAVGVGAGSAGAAGGVSATSAGAVTSGVGAGASTTGGSR